MTKAGGDGVGRMDAGEIDVAEIEAAWTAVFGGPPSVRAEPGMLLAALVAYMTPAPPYRPDAEPRGDED